MVNKNPVTLEPPLESRGGVRFINKVIERDEAVNSHIESYKPQVSHYRRAHAPHWRYLPHELTVRSMHEDFITTHPEFSNCSYEKYRSCVAEKNIKFVKLVHEECEDCEVSYEHNSLHPKDNLCLECETCMKWKEHHSRASESRKLYNEHAEEAKKSSEVSYYSIDLQKVIMLPRLEMFKSAIFTRRLTA